MSWMSMVAGSVVDRSGSSVGSSSMPSMRSWKWLRSVSFRKKSIMYYCAWMLIAVDFGLVLLCCLFYYDFFVVLNDVAWILMEFYRWVRLNFRECKY